MALRDVIAFFDVQFNTAKLDEGNKKVDQGIGLLKGLGAALGAAFAIDRIKHFTLGLVEQADTIGDTATQLNISTDALQEWQLAGEDAGVTGENLVAIFTKLSSAADKADDGTKGVAKTLKEIGVSVEGSGGQLKDASTLFEETGLALAGLEDRTKALSIASQLFGRGNAAKILQMFKDGAPGIAKAREEFHRLGGGFDPEFIENSGKVKSQLAALDVAWTSMKVKIVGLVLPAVSALISVLGKGAQAIGDLVKGTNIGVVAAGAAAATAAWLGFGKALSFVRQNWKLLAAALIAEDIVSFLRGDESLTGDIIEFFFGPSAPAKVRDFLNDVIRAVGQTFQELRDSPVQFAEDFSLALDAMRADLEALPLGAIWATIFDQMLFAIDVLTGGWDNAVAKISALGSGLGLFLETIWLGVKAVGLEAAAALSDAWTSTVNSIKSLASNIPGLGSLGEGLKPGTALADVQKTLGAEKQQLSARYDANLAALGAPRGGSSVTSNVTAPIQVNLYGSDASPQAVASAAQRGVQNANRTASAALVQRGGKT